MMTSASRKTSPAVVCLGRLGDVTAALPIAHELYYRTGGATPFIVSRAFASILEGCSYVNAVPIDIPFFHLGRALRTARLRHGELHVAQMYATDLTMPENRTSSFVTDAWNRAGMLHKFGLPLVIDRRNREREKVLTALHAGPYVVVHVGGVSSPYRYRHDLLNALRGQTVLDITGMAAERPQDMLAVLERASCAILADSFPLHLSYALRDLPVIALQTDKPTDWFGAPPRPNWIAKYRYEESRGKLEEIAELARSVKSKPLPLFSFPAGGYNGSLLPRNGGHIYTWRYHPNNSWQTQLRGSDGEKVVPIDVGSKAESQEDARLFMYQGKPHVSFTLSSYTDRKPRCVVEYGELVLGKTAWKVKKPKRVKVGRNDFSGMEKNHVFWSAGPYLYCLYGSHPEQVVLEIDGERVVREHRSPGIRWGFGDVRGDVIVPYEGVLLRVFHSQSRYASGKFRYHIGVARLSPSLPFETLSFTKSPVFSGDETHPKTAHHTKQNVVFVCGAVVDGDDLLISLSHNDDSCALVRVNIKQLGL